MAENTSVTSISDNNHRHAPRHRMKEPLGVLLGNDIPRCLCGIPSYAFSNDKPDIDRGQIWRTGRQGGITMECDELKKKIKH